jgi:hypothetical protein
MESGARCATWCEAMTNWLAPNPFQSNPFLEEAMKWSRYSNPNPVDPFLLRRSEEAVVRQLKNAAEQYGERRRDQLSYLTLRRNRTHSDTRTFRQALINLTRQGVLVPYITSYGTPTVYATVEDVERDPMPWNYMLATVAETRRASRARSLE